MSHELRTPLNNLLILAQMLSENAESTLTAKQVKYRRNDSLLRHRSAGPDQRHPRSEQDRIRKDGCGNRKRPVHGGAGLLLADFPPRGGGQGPGVQSTWRRIGRARPFITDAKRLQQVLKNLLSNALKFTEQGSVRLRIGRAASGWSANHPVLSRAKSVIAFSVTDTGIGIPQDKQRIIFEAFQQADGTTSRKYGGTGLGLSISRELARLLGGEIRLRSVPGSGSTFTLYLPQTYGTAAPKPETASMDLPGRRRPSRLRARRCRDRARRRYRRYDLPGAAAGPLAGGAERRNR